MRTATLKPDRRAPTVELRFPKGEKHRGRPLIDFLRKHLSGSIWWNGEAWETNGIGVSPEALLVRWGFTLTAPFESGVTPVSKLSTNRRHVLVRPMLVGRAACQEMLGLSATWDAKRGLFLLPIADICPNGNTPISGVRFSAEAIELARRRHTHTSAPSARLQEALVHASTATSPKDLSRADRDVMVAAVGRLPDWFGIDLFGYQKVGAMAVACGRRLLADEPGIGKCLDGRTLVEVDGDLIRIADLWNQNSAGAYPDQENPDFAELVDVQDKHYQVPSLSTPSGQQTNATVSHLYRQRYDGQMIQIQTRSGRRITCTPQHRFWTSEGWLQAGELSAGSWLSAKWAGVSAPGVGWDEVQEVETVHHSGYIYDLVVPETHCYVASGLYTHNTYQSIAAAVLMGASRILVVSPPLAITNWLRELERCGVVAADSTARNFALKVSDKTRKRWVTPPPCRADRPVAVVVSDSLLAQRDGLAPTLTEWSPDVVIWDEAHRGKTYGSKRSEAVLQLTHDCSAAGIAVTGTPMLKSPAELAPLMEFTGQDVSVFGGLRQLLDHTCTLDRYGRLRPSRKGEDWLQERLAGQVMIRRTKKQVSPHLPAKHRYPIYVDAPMASFNKAHKEVNQKIDQWLKDWRSQHGAFPDDEAILDYATGNLGYISQLRKAAGVCKVPVAEEMIAQHIEQTRTSSGVYSDPLIVWTHHKEVTEALAERVPSIDGAAMIIGGMSRARRDQLIDEFQAGHVGALICSTHAAGVAITLTRCHTMLFVETDWTPGIVVQAEDRAHRTGQTADQVSIGTLVCTETLDPIVQATLHRKAQFLDATIGGDNSVYVDEDDELTATDVLVNLVQARRETLGA